jgi:hypothetical protein
VPGNGLVDSTIDKALSKQALYNPGAFTNNETQKVLAIDAAFDILSFQKACALKASRDRAEILTSAPHDSILIR